MTNFEHFGGVQDPFVIRDELLLGSLWIGGHEVGFFSDFFDGSVLRQDEEIVFGGVGVGEDQLNRLPGFDGEFVLGEEETLGDGADLDGGEIFLAVELLFILGELFDNGLFN